MTDKEVYRYVLEHGLRVSPVYDLGLGSSGECMCGSFARKGTKEIIMANDPKLARYIKWLEEGVRLFGTKQAKKYGRWGEAPAMTDLEVQQTIEGYRLHNAGVDLDAAESVSCGVECGGGTLRGETDYDLPNAYKA